MEPEAVRRAQRRDNWPSDPSRATAKLDFNSKQRMSSSRVPGREGSLIVRLLLLLLLLPVAVLVLVVVPHDPYPLVARYSLPRQSLACLLRPPLRSTWRDRYSQPCIL